MPVTVTVTIFNIVIFGEAGAGKSSVINLLADASEPLADTSSGAQRCTTVAKQYQRNWLKQRYFNFWDTAGVAEQGVEDVDYYLSTINNTIELIQTLTRKGYGGIDLLLLCISGKPNRITPSIRSNYRLFYEVLCKKKIPIALVVTHLEREDVMEDWWTRNETCITKTYGLRFSGHACVTGLRHHAKATESRDALQKLLLDYSDDGRYRMSVSMFQRIVGWFERKQSQCKVELHLRDRCGLTAPVASRLAEKLARESNVYQGFRDVSSTFLPITTATETHTPCNVVIFGESGSGKTSAINLIAEGRHVVPRQASDGCVFQLTRHRPDRVCGRFDVWETAGMTELDLGSKDYLAMVKRMFDLLLSLASNGGVNLLLFCIPGNRITASMQRNFHFFYEILFKKRVPIALIVTHLENESDMQGWWTENQSYVADRCGHQFADHVCVTGLVDDAKTESSRSAMKALLAKFEGSGRYRSPPVNDWFDCTLQASTLVLRPRNVKKKVLQKVLRECGLDASRASRVAENIGATSAGSAHPTTTTAQQDPASATTCRHCCCHLCAHEQCYRDCTERGRREVAVQTDVEVGQQVVSLKRRPVQTEGISHDSSESTAQECHHALEAEQEDDFQGLPQLELPECLISPSYLHSSDLSYIHILILTISVSYQHFNRACHVLEPDHTRSEEE